MNTGSETRRLRGEGSVATVLAAMAAMALLSGTLPLRAAPAAARGRGALVATVAVALGAACALLARSFP